LHGSLASLLGGVAILAGVFVVHELGHYLAGAIAGIPADARRFIVLAVPPHVALADGEEWVSPFQNDRFSDVYGRYDPERRYGALFTAGGILAQAVLAVVVAVVVVAVGGAELGRDVVRLSLAFLAGLLVVDLAATVSRGRPYSDATHLWRLDPLRAVAGFAATFGVHVAVLWWLGRAA
jgi:hypothetical protein